MQYIEVLDHSTSCSTQAVLILCLFADSLVEAQELVLSSRGQPCQRIPLVPVSRPIGQNDVGIVAWVMTLKSPECPTGRKVCD